MEENFDPAENYCLIVCTLPPYVVLPRGEDNNVDGDGDDVDAGGVAGWDCHHHWHCCGFLADIQHQTNFPASLHMIMMMSVMTNMIMMRW